MHEHLERAEFLFVGGCQLGSVGEGKAAYTDHEMVLIGEASEAEAGLFRGLDEAGEINVRAEIDLTRAGQGIGLATML